MIELLGGGVLGGLIGGVFRLAPEVLKWMDRKDERKHELAMFASQCDLEKQRGAQKLTEIGAQRDADVDSGMMAAFKTAIDSQTAMATAAGGWAAALSASVRPVLTYYLLALYGTVKFVGIAYALGTGEPVAAVLARSWGVDDMAMLAGVINYWMLDRSLAKRGLA